MDDVSVTRTVFENGTVASLLADMQKWLGEKEYGLDENGAAMYFTIDGITISDRADNGLYYGTIYWY